MTPKPPYADTQLSAFLRQRILELQPRKSQQEIGHEAGFMNVNMMSMLKSGRTKLPLARVGALAKALDCDPARLFQLALTQSGEEAVLCTIKEIFGTPVTRNELVWLEAIRTQSGNSDPTLNTRAHSAIRGIFGN